jgi:hypothetical protein
VTTWLPSQPDATLIGLPDKQLFDRATEHKRVLMIENIKDFELLRRLAAEEAGLMPVCSHAGSPRFPATAASSARSSPPSTG